MGRKERENKAENGKTHMVLASRHSRLEGRTKERRGRAGASTAPVVRSVEDVRVVELACGAKLFHNSLQKLVDALECGPAVAKVLVDAKGHGKGEADATGCGTTAGATRCATASAPT